MRMVTANMSISLDGFIAGPNISLENPVGEGGGRLHEWMFPPQADFQMIVDEMFTNVGAVIMGRQMFNTGEEPWGDNPPFHMRVFVLTHQSKQQIIKDGGTTFTFVTDGIESALKQAKMVAGDKDVMVASGANAVQQYIQAGVLDEIRLHLIPVLLGKGIQLFANIDIGPLELETTQVTESANVTHLKFHFVK